MEDSQVAIILEGIRKDFRVFGDGLMDVNRKIDVLSVDVQDLKQKVNQNTIEIKALQFGQREIQKDMKEMKQDIHVLKEDVHVLKQDVSVLKVETKEVKQDIKSIKSKLEIHDIKLAIVK
jgi:chromosome segregation ATPase